VGFGEERKSCKTSHITWLIQRIKGKYN
jgi:hypothetical protein